MAINFSKQIAGITLVPQNTTVPTINGDIRFNSASSKLEVYNGAVDPVVTEVLAATLTNKTLTGNIAANFLNGSATITLPSSTDTLVGRATTDTLTNKTIVAGSNTISGITNSNLSGTAGISNANLASMATGTVKGNISGSAGAPSDLTASQLNTLLGSLTTVGTIDSQTPSSNGLVISSGSIYAQSASATAPGMLSTGTQTIAGDKTFTGTIFGNSIFMSGQAASPQFILTQPGFGHDIYILPSASTVTAYNLYLPSAQATTSGQVLSNDGAGNLSWVTPSGVSYKAPTYQIFRSGSGTYTPPTGPAPLYIEVQMVGGGGGGGGGGVAGTTGGGGNGGDTTFNGVTATHGIGAQEGTGAQGNAAVSVSSGYSFGGTAGTGEPYFSTSTTQYMSGGTGGSSFFGGGGKGNGFTAAGVAGATNSGSGGGGGGTGASNGTQSMSPGGGGSSGVYVNMTIAPGTYSYSVGVGGTAGANGTGGGVGGAGAAGIIIVKEFYQ